MDVVRSVVFNNQRRFATQPNWAFELADITQARAVLGSGREILLTYGSVAARQVKAQPSTCHAGTGCMTVCKALIGDRMELAGPAAARV